MDDKCRLCGNSDQNLVNLFENNKPFANLYSRICINLQIKISITDKLSHSVCQICSVKLEDFDRFIKQCQKYQFFLAGADETVFSPAQERISAMDLECVPLCVSSDFSDYLLEESENEVPLKVIQLSRDFQDECDDVILEEDEVIKIDLDGYESEKLVESKQEPIENIPYSKLVTFFSSRVRVNKFNSSGETYELKSNPNIDPSYESCANLIEPETDHEMAEIKCEKIESSSVPDEKDLQNGKHRANFHQVWVKNEEAVIPKDIKARNPIKVSISLSKSKSPHLKSCPLCAHEFAPDELEEHVKFHSNDQEYIDFIIAEMKEPQSKNKNHYCEECKRVFSLDSSFLEHKKEHMKMKIINCHLCDHSFSIRKKLKVHLRAVHIPKNNKCNLCSYASKSQADLQKHIKGVHEFQPIICEICGRSFSCNMSNYKRHLETHSEERMYKCDRCDSSYKTQSSLKKHKTNIHFPKPVMCTACGTISGSLIKYKKHVRRCRKRMQRFS